MAKLSKLKIVGFSDPGCKSKIGEFVCDINPSSYKHTHSVGYNKGGKAEGGAGETPNFDSINPEKVSFELTLDGTGVIPNAKDVVTSIKKLKGVVYYYQAKIHKPAFLKLIWAENFQRTKQGAQDFKCHMTSMDITYSLFKPNGTPLRAKVSLSFEEFRSAKETLQADQGQSPDMTHVKIIRQGDTLSQLCHEIYDDPSYYLQVAKANRLVDLKVLEPGTRLVFPPLKILPESV